MLCKILKLRPKIDKQFAVSLSFYIAKYAKQFEFDPAISVAIAMQESSLSNKNRMGTVLKDGKFVRGITDVGVFQIHVDTMADLNNTGNRIDYQRLLADIGYQTYWHAKILSAKIKTCKAKRATLKVSAGNEWSCYHSFTYTKRKTYLKDVSRHIVKLTSL